jgi:hypothetical protein
MWEAIECDWAGRRPRRIFLNGFSFWLQRHFIVQWYVVTIAAKVTVTGCLQKGDQAEEFAITGENGKKYELVSRTVKLSGHVGHKVSVTGTVLGEEDEENEGQEEGGWIQVTRLKMISETCK